MEQVMTGLLFFNVFLLAIMLVCARQTVRLLKKQIKCLEEIQARQGNAQMQQDECEQRRNAQMQQSEYIQQGNVQIQQNKSTWQECQQMQSVKSENIDDKNGKEQLADVREENADLINKVLSEIFS